VKAETERFLEKARKLLEEAEQALATARRFVVVLETLIRDP